MASFNNSTRSLNVRNKFLVLAQCMCCPWLFQTECHSHYFSLSSAAFAFLPEGLFKGSEILHGLLTNKGIKILLQQILIGLTRSIYKDVQHNQNCTCCPNCELTKIFVCDGVTMASINRHAEPGLHRREQKLRLFKAIISLTSIYGDRKCEHILLIQGIWEKLKHYSSG